MADNSFKPQERKKIVLDNNKLDLKAKNAEGKMATLKWGLIGNNPRITVFTNTADNGKVDARLDAPIFYAFLQLILQVIRSKEDIREKIDNKNYTWFGGKKSETPSVVSSLIVGKENGVIYISVTAPKQASIQFFFKPSEFHNFIHGDGTPWTDSEMSVLMAKSYVELLGSIMTIAMDTNYEAPPPREQTGNGFGGQTRTQNAPAGNSYGNQGAKQQPTRPQPAESDFEENWG